MGVYTHTYIRTYIHMNVFVFTVHATLFIPGIEFGYLPFCCVVHLTRRLETLASKWSFLVNSRSFCVQLSQQKLETSRILTEYQVRC